MEEKKVILIIGVDNPTPEKEREFNEWYDGHIKEIMEQRPGVKNVTRYTSTDFRVAGPEGVTYPKYITIYEFDSEESLREYDAHRHKLKQSGQYQQHTYKYEEKKGIQPPKTTMLKEKWRTAYTKMAAREKGVPR